MVAEIRLDQGQTATITNENGVMVIRQVMVRPPPPPPAVIVGADPSVEQGTFVIPEDFLPEFKGPVRRLEEFGGRAEIDFDNSEALKRAWASFPNDGAVLDLPGMYGLKGNTRLKGKSDITFQGRGRGTGFAAVDQRFPGSRWRCLVEFEGTSHLAFLNAEIDVRGQRIGGLWHKNDTNTLFAGLYVHDIDGGPSAGTTPLAAIKGADKSTWFHMIGCLVENGWGDAGQNSGVRGYWGAGVMQGADIHECIFQRMGHTGLAVYSESDVMIRRVTSRRNAGAGMKLEQPESHDNDWLPSPPVSDVLECLFEANGFTGIQIEGYGAHVHHNLIRAQERGITSFNRNKGNIIEQNRFEEIGEYGLFFDNQQAIDMGHLAIANNTILGRAGMRSGVYFYDKFKHPVGPIALTDNRVISATVDAVRLTRELADHDGLEMRGNGSEAVGASWSAD